MEFAVLREVSVASDYVSIGEAGASVSLGQQAEWRRTQDRHTEKLLHVASRGWSLVIRFRPPNRDRTVSLCVSCAAFVASSSAVSAWTLASANPLDQSYGQAAPLWIASAKVPARSRLTTCTLGCKRLPCCYHLRVSRRKQIDDEALLKIAQDRPIPMALLPGPLIESKHRGEEGVGGCARLLSSRRSVVRLASKPSLRASLVPACPPSARVTQLRPSLERQLPRA